MNAASEPVSRIEPCFLENAGGALLDLLAEIPAAASRLGARLHPKTAASLASLVRVMNCYYSNLIEGHNTRPKDIERALADDLDANEARRNLQLEARAHIRIQEAIDAEAAAGTLADPASLDFLLRLHREFYRDAPDVMLRIEGDGRSFLMTPGTLRNDPLHDVAVGRHIPPGSDAVARFMAYFSERYRLGSLSTSRRLLAIPAAHHRFNYIHPFPDGNGRVSRLSMASRRAFPDTPRSRSGGLKPRDCCWKCCTVERSRVAMQPRLPDWENARHVICWRCCCAMECLAAPLKKAR